MRKILIAGNWKMNGNTARNTELVAEVIDGSAPSETVEVLLCPPFPYLAAVAEQVGDSHLMVGAQNVSEHESGPYTGETSAAMLKDVGCQYAIVGHSERRTQYGESDEQVAAKFRAALDGGLTPILCVGETLEEREAMQTESVISRQLAAVVAATGIEAFSRAVIAYEPIWAIGTGKVATPEQAQDVHMHIRGMLSAENAEVAAGVQILYGGSKKGENAPGLLAMPDIDGGLVGGAALDAADFVAIIEAAVNAAG